MTCVEKLKEIYPEEKWTDERIRAFIGSDCPDDHYIMKEPSWCLKTHDCEKCWNREVHDEDAPWWKEIIYFRADDIRRLERLERRLEKPGADVIGIALKLLEDAENVAVAYADVEGGYPIRPGELRELLEVKE